MNHDLQKLKNKVALFITLAGLRVYTIHCKTLKGGNRWTFSNRTLNYSNRVVSALYVLGFRELLLQCSLYGFSIAHIVSFLRFPLTASDILVYVTVSAKTGLVRTW